MSRVTDPLREYIAKTWDGSMYVNQVPMRLLDIADQIDTEHERLEQGNAKLRELVADMWRHGMCECEHERDCVACQFAYPGRMQELGIWEDE